MNIYRHKRILPVFASLGLMVWARAVSAHESEAVHPHFPAVVRTLSLVAVTVVTSLLCGLLAYQFVQKAAAKKRGESYRGRSPKPFLFALLGCVALVLAVQRFAVKADSELDALRGAPDDAQFALTDKLATIPNEQHKPLLLRYAQDENGGLRYAAVDALAAVLGKESADAVEAAFLDPVYTVREKALYSLPKLDPERGLSLLLSALHDEDTQIREDASLLATSRSVFPDPQTPRRMVPTLMDALDDTSGLVVVNSVRVLAKTTGNNWTVSPLAPEAERKKIVAKWKTWWQTKRANWDAPPVANTAPRQPLAKAMAPDFSLRDWNGKTFSMAEQRGRVTLLNFWGTWCSPCVQEIPELVRLDTEYRSKGLDIVGLALNEPDGERGLQKWCRGHGVTYRQAICSSYVQDIFGDLEGVPVSILIGRDGRILRQWDGLRDYETFRKAVEHALK